MSQDRTRQYSVRCKTCQIIAHNVTVEQAAHVIDQHKVDKPTHKDVMFYPIPTPLEKSTL